MRPHGTRKNCQGAYKISLYRLFFALALTIALILCTLTGWFLNRQSRSDYYHYLEQSAVSQKNISSLSVNVIVNAIGACTKGTEITRWVDSSTLPEFYFNAIAASRKIQAATTDILQVEYQVAVTPLNPRAYHGVITNMVLTGNRSLSIENYCAEHNLSSESYLQIVDHFQEKETPIVLPRYHSETGKLEEIQYIVKNTGKIHPYLFFITIPIDSLLQDTLAESFFLYNDSGVFALSQQGERQQERAREIYEQLMIDENNRDFSRLQILRGQHLMVTEIPYVGWHLVRHYPPLPLHVQGLLLFLVVVCACVALALTLSYYLVERLYHPVKELLEASVLPHKGLEQLHICYQEALRILDYRFLHAKSRLITYQEISSIDAVTYSYPLQMENRLIHCALEGKQEAIEIFETIIRDNIRDKDLSKETLQNLIYALIGTISRIFQEMKTIPQDFLGKDIDFRYLYNHWNDSAVFIEIKEILESIIQTVCKQENSRDQELLDKMLGYIYQNYSDDIMLNDLADYLNISPKYCGILFKQLSDNNFKDFLNRYRIDRSKEILEQDPSIKIVDLSAMVGFNSSNSFIRVFNKYVGITPKAYQDRMRESH